MATCANCATQIGLLRKMTGGGLCENCERAAKEQNRPRSRSMRHCVAKQKGGVYTVESGWRLPSERDGVAVRTRVEAAGHPPEPLSDGFLVRDPWRTGVAFVTRDQDEQSSHEQT